MRTPPLRHRLPAAVALLLATAIVAPGPARADDDALGARAASDLRSPVEAVRRAALARVVAAGPTGRDLARGWLRSGDRRLRAGAWQALAAVGEAEDVREALAALAGRDAAVGLEAARAVVAMATRLPTGTEPALPAGSLAPGGRRPLAMALAEALEVAHDDALPEAVTRLGEGVLPALGVVLAHPRFGLPARLGALRAIAAFGGDAARRLLSEHAAQADPWQDWRYAQAWWSAVLEVGPGPGLERAEAMAVEIAVTADEGGRRGRRLPWSLGDKLYRFFAQCPPVAGRAAVRDFLQGMIARAADSSRWRLDPRVAGAVVRAFLVVGAPDDEALGDCVLAAQTRAGPRKPRQVEALGEVLALLEPYREREGVRESARLLLTKEDLPETVRAWARYLAGETPPAELAAEAAELIDAGGAAASLDQRRLGARLLDRLGAPPLARIRAFREDVDPWLRALAIAWSRQACRDRRLPPDELAAAVAAGLADPQDSVFLVACEGEGAELAPDHRQRLLDLAVAGPRSLRGRAWTALGALLGEPGDGATAEPLPRSHTALDERLRAAAAVRDRWLR